MDNTGYGTTETTITTYIESSVKKKGAQQEQQEQHQSTVAQLVPCTNQTYRQGTTNDVLPRLQC